LYGYQNKQELLSYATLRDWFFKTEVERVHCSVPPRPYIKGIHLGIKGLMLVAAVALGLHL